MSSARKGRDFEYKARNLLIECGWTHVMRAAASKGPGDLLMGHPDHGGALIQVGAKSKRLDPADRSRLCDAAELIGALPLLFTFIDGTPKGRTLICIVDRGMPAQWARFEPIEVST